MRMKLIKTVKHSPFVRSKASLLKIKDKQKTTIPAS